MKKIISIVVLAFAAVSLYAQGGKDIYNRYSGKKGVSAVYISPAMFNLIKELPDIQVESDDVNLSGIIKGFSGMYILDVEEPSLAGQLASEISSMVEKGKYELLMEAVDEGEKMHIYIVREGDMVTDFLMYAAESDSTSVISISGTIPMAELQKALAAAAE